MTVFTIKAIKYLTFHNKFYFVSFFLFIPLQSSISYIKTKLFNTMFVSKLMLTLCSTVIEFLFKMSAFDNFEFNNYTSLESAVKS